jgi:hypothetical protein
MDYMICTRNITRTGFGSEPGPARFLSIPTRARRPTPAHAVPRIEKDRWVERVLTASKKGANPDEPVPEGDILIFVHGYNNSPEIVLARQRQLSRDLARLKFDGVVIGFDWPSGDRTLNYLEDRSDARKTALHLVKDGIRLFALPALRATDQLFQPVRQRAEVVEYQTGGCCAACRPYRPTGRRERQGRQRALRGAFQAATKATERDRVLAAFLAHRRSAIHERLTAHASR